MTDTTSSTSSASPAPLFDTSIVPLDERAWKSILDHVVAVGDEAETSYLEVKSDIAPKSRLGRAKIAKFLLGMANRDPKSAERHFRGYGVLVIGAQKGEALGIPRGTEPHELEDALRPYLGPQFPGFEFGRLAVDAEREVLFVIALPPEDGQPIFPCLKESQGEDREDNLTDGAIYVRGPSNTRPARASQVLALVERARGTSKPPVDLDVNILGAPHRVELVEEVLDALYEHEVDGFEVEAQSTPHDPMHALLAQSVIHGNRPLSTEERQELFDAWKANSADHRQHSREYLLGTALPGLGIEVVSRERVVTKPELIVTFHHCEAYRYRDIDDAEWGKLVEPILPTRSPYGIATPDYDYYNFVPRDYPVSWKNAGEDVEVTISRDSLRPDTPWASETDDYVIVAREEQATAVSATWSLTEDGNDERTTGGFTIPLGDIIDARDLVKRTFLDEG